MAKLQVNDDWRIISDPLNWIVQRRTATENENGQKESWHNEGYYPVFGMALEALVERELKIADDIIDIKNKLDEINSIISSKAILSNDKDKMATDEQEDDEMDNLLS